MRALVVTPNQADSTRLMDVPEPPPDAGSLLVGTLAIGICGTDVEIAVGPVWLGAAGLRPAGDRPRIHRPRAGVSAGIGVRRGRSRRRHRAAAGPGAVRLLRDRRVGHVPERAIHRTRHQGTGRLRLGTLPARAGVRRQGRRRSRPSGRSARTGQRRRQGVGPCRTDRPAIVGVGAALGARDRGRADRPAGGADRSAARARRACLRPDDRRPRSRSWCALSARTYHGGDLSVIGSWRRMSSSSAPARRRSLPMP